MKVLIPLAGRGSRFIEAGYTLPKPLVLIIKEPMIRWATKNLNIEDKDLIFFILKIHIDNYQLDQKLREIFSANIKIVVVDKITEGAPITLLQAKDIIDTEEELLIFNGDQNFKENIIEMIRNLPLKYSGLIPVFHSTQTKFSYAQVDKGMDVIEVAEKIPISSYATAGVYYFRHGKDFVWATEQMISKDIRRGNEFFVCPVYNELLGRGDKIKATLIETFWPLGTPEDVEHFKRYYHP
ncbi:glycosyl transferase family 2 [Candidatus Woesearchaeota archaeon CG_4_10_14_0_2_um_filter_33_13]|nr:MAG: glycosyl transferase family 2 [Candidatus Woesearchaeota archaeon CG_4_10_14_0_2_um_filter_33_13]